jgi:sugar phosphate permease
MLDSRRCPITVGIRPPALALETSLVVGVRLGSMIRSPNSLWRWQALTVSMLVLGYAGYYLCRSDYSVALPLIIAEMAARGTSVSAATIQMGSVASLGVLAYAFGKFVSGGLGDFLGGKRNFLMGMFGSVVFTILFALGGGPPVFMLAWIGNRLVQSMGWAGMVKLTSKWFSYSTYGTAMGVISLSYLFGDAASRQFMAILIGRGMGWRGVFLTAGATLAVLAALNLLLLKESPREVGHAEPPSNPSNVFREEGDKHRPANLARLLKPLLGSGVFWLVCLLSFGFTIIREAFNIWTPTYFTQAVGMSHASAAGSSALFPLFGGISVLAAGFLSDRLGNSGRAAIIFYGSFLSGTALLALAKLKFESFTAGPVLLVMAVAFLTLGPYSYLAGAIALDFGGKHGSATASGFIDGVGYLGGVLAGNSVAHVSVTYGWKGAFTSLAAVAWLSTLAAAAYFVHQRRLAEALVENT